jgi:hypothetical protein
MLRFEQPFRSTGKRDARAIANTAATGNETFYFVDIDHDCCFVFPEDHVKLLIEAALPELASMVAGSLRGRNWMQGTGPVSIPTSRAFKRVNRSPDSHRAVPRAPTQAGAAFSLYDFKLHKDSCTEWSVGKHLLARLNRRVVRVEHKAALRSQEYPRGTVFIEYVYKYKKIGWDASGIANTAADIWAIEWRRDAWMLFRTERLRELADAEYRKAGEYVITTNGLAKGVLLSLPGVIAEAR